MYTCICIIMYKAFRSTCTNTCFPAGDAASRGPDAGDCPRHAHGLLGDCRQGATRDAETDTESRYRR